MEVKPIGDKINERLNCPLSSKSRSRSILPLPPKEEAFSRHVTANVGNKTDTKNALKRLRLRTKISFRGSTLFALSNDYLIIRLKPLYADCGSARPVRRSFRIRINKLTFFPISDRQKRFHTQRLRRGSQSPALPVLAFLQLLVFFGHFSYCNYYYIPRKKFVNRFSTKFKKTLRQENNV